jgi:hypothetical protein
MGDGAGGGFSAEPAGWDPREGVAAAKPWSSWKAAASRWRKGSVDAVRGLWQEHRIAVETTIKTARSQRGRAGEIAMRVSPDSRCAKWAPSWEFA